jgi:hypothetical protein
MCASIDEACVFVRHHRPLGLFCQRRHIRHIKARAITDA